MAETVKYLTFSVEGEFVTERALHAFYEENNLPLAIDILMSATCTDQLSDAEHMELVLSILNGEKELRGNSATSDYGVYDVVERNPKYNVKNHLEQMRNELKSMKDKLKFVMDYLMDNDGYHKLIDIDDEYREYSDGDTIFGTKPKDDINYLSPTAKKRMATPEHSSEVITATYGSNSLLDDFLKHVKESKDDDYGWLEPDGTYHVVEWGDHSQFAMDYLKEHYPINEKNEHLYWLEDDDGSKKPIMNGDVLVYKLHWVLLDSPSQGFARPTYDTKYGYTKAQKEFLFDYYMACNCKDLAYDLYKEEE